jgi:tryptophan synthase alpha chain
VLGNASGFVYYVSIAGITGTASASNAAIAAAVARLRRHTALPVAVGFGIKTPAMAAEVGALADAAVVGSAIVNTIVEGLDKDGKPKPGLAEAVHGFVKSLAQGVRSVKRKAEAV